MDILTNKQWKRFDKLSRYQTFPIYYNKKDNKYESGITDWLDDSTSYVIHKIKDGDSLDSIALYYYGNPTYYWIIADYNRMLDAFETLIPGNEIKIPSFSDIRYNY